MENVSGQETIPEPELYEKVYTFHEFLNNGSDQVAVRQILGEVVSTEDKVNCIHRFNLWMAERKLHQLTQEKENG